MFRDEYIKELEEKGCKRWTKYDRDRLYLKAEALGLSWKYKSKNSGSLGGCYWRDDEISNKAGNGILDILEASYLDLITGKFIYNPQNARYGTNGTIYEILKELIAEFKEEWDCGRNS